MLKDYILGNEIAALGKFKINNVSNVIKRYSLIEGQDYIKTGALTFLSKKSNKLPNNFKVLVEKGTDLSEYLPYSYVVSLLDSRILIKNKCRIIEFYNKKFVEFLDPDIKEVMLNTSLVKTTINKEDFLSLDSDSFKGSIKLSYKKYLVYY